MAKLSIQVGSISQTINVFIQDSTSTTGAGLTGLAYNSTGLTAYYALPLSTPVAITLATLASVTAVWSSGGFKEIDSTHMPGWYRLDLPNAALASGRFVDLHLQGATNMAPLPIEIELTAINNQDATQGGITNLDAAVSSRAPAATALSTVNWTNGRASNLDNLDAAVSSRAPAATALSTVNWTNGRASNLDNLDAAVSTRSTYAGTDTPGTTTLLSRLTALRGSYLDNLGLQLTEAYAANNTPATMIQLLYMTYTTLQNFSIAGTALSVKKLDGATVWGTVTLNDAVNPTSRVRTA